MSIGKNLLVLTISFGMLTQALFAAVVTISQPVAGSSRGKTSIVTGTGKCDSDAMTNTPTFSFGKLVGGNFNAENQHGVTLTDVGGGICRRGRLHRPSPRGLVGGSGNAPDHR